MKKMMRALVTFLTLCSLIASQAAALRAEENQGYGYSLTLSSGSGAFTEIMADVVTVNGNPVQATATDHEVTISGLHYGDAVQLNVQTEGAVTHADGRYHVRGYRLSGRDAVVENNEVITVKGDASYVVAYSVPGNLVAYTIHYEDAEGQTLAASQTFYGTIGDPISAAMLNIDGYVPTPACQQLIQNTRLAAESAENEFTFVYEASAVRTTTNTNVETVTRTEEVTNTIGVQVNNPQPPVNNGQQEQPVEVVEDNNTPTNGGQEVPQQETVEEAVTPQSGGQAAGGMNLFMIGGIVALIAVIGLIIVVMKKEKEADSEE